MAKFYGSGYLTGKSGNKVYAMRRGAVIERQYMPNVFNPKSEAQSIQRAKFKTMSQLSAILRPAMAVRPVGLESVRNAFSRLNKGALVWNDAASKVDVNLLSIDLTGSAAALPSLSQVTANAQLQVSLARDPQESIDGVMYFAVADVGGKFTVMGSTVVNVPGADHHYAGIIDFGATLTGVVYAYGFRYLSERASVVYGSLIAESGTAASLLLTRMVSDDDIVFTTTQSVTITAS